MHLYLWRWSALLDNWTPHSLSLSGLRSYLISLDPHPLAAITWLLLTVSWFRNRRRLGPITCSRVGLLLIFSGVGLLLITWERITYRLLLHVMPTLGLVACWWVSQRTHQAGTVVKRYWPAALLALFMLWGVVRIGHNLSWRGNTRVEFPTATFRTRPEDAAWLEQAVATVHQRHPPGSSCFILGRGSPLHILTQTWPAGEYPNTVAFFLTPDEYRKVWLQVARRSPHYVYGFLRDPADLYNDPSAAPFIAQFAEHYQVHTRIDSHAGTFVVWEKRTE